MNACEVKILAFDLDGTFLDTQKRVSVRNLKALEDVAKRGVVVVPTTGRIFEMIPTEIREIAFARYFITSNGAQVYDRKTDTILVREEIPLEMALELMRYLEQFDVIYDCYQENRGWITERFMRNVAAYIPDAMVLKLVREYRTCVPELKVFLQGRGKDVQKILVNVKRSEDCERIAEGVRERFPRLVMGSSSKFNIEFNIETAHKGYALKKLAESLGYTLDNCMAIGDGTNDFTMIKMAGLGIAMENAFDEVKKVAEWVTKTNDQDGFAVAIEKFLI